MKYKDMRRATKMVVWLILGTYSLFTYWLFWPYDPMQCDGIVIMNADKEVAPGSLLWYSAEIDKKLPIQATIYVQLLNDFVINYTPSPGTLPLGKRIVKAPLKIPDYAQPGAYKMKWEGHYQVNPIREVVVTVWSEPFKVRKKRRQE